MSEIGWYISRIRLKRELASNIEANPSFEILKKSLEMVVEKYGGRLTNSVTDALGRVTYCDFAISTPNFPRGVGIEINRETGEVAFLYDEYGDFREVARRLVDEITQNYVAIALIRAMRSLGYQVEEEEESEERGAVVLVGRV
jgi:hypothetical protein